MAYIFNDSQFLDAEFLVLSDSEEKKMKDEPVPETIGLLTLKNTVLFPGVVIPITVGRDKSIQLIKDANKAAGKDKVIGVVSQKNMGIEDPAAEDIYHTGTLAHILKVIKMPDGSMTVVIQGRNRFRIREFLQSEPYFKASVVKLEDIYPERKQTEALDRNLKKEAYRIIELSPNIPSEAKVALKNIHSLSFLIHFIASNLNMEIREKQEILEMDSLLKKGEIILANLGNELAILELTEEIQSKVRVDLDKQQREYFLRQQIKAIQSELGEGEEGSDADRFRKRAAEKKWPERVQGVFEKEVLKLNRLQPHMPDYAVVANYLEWLLDLPWQEYSQDQFDFRKTQKILDDDHYGLEKVKDRILEYLAVLKLKADKKAPILCFYGPPGVGKTSLGKSIAKSLGREFVRISLGGVRDEAEIRGHRRTYIGALPGRIIQGMKKAKTGNPVFMLDEIDKVGNDFRGDPSSALLEVLDPEQNNTFQDHFLEVEYDLSRVMFIATANTLDSVHPALRDRMEIIQITGYSTEEKIMIARQHLMPRMLEEHGLNKKNLKLSETALRGIIEGYTRESGVRMLAQKIAGVCRGVAKEVVMNNAETVSVNKNSLHDFLGVARYENRLYQKVDQPGVAIGLAWTPVGGDILFIETSLHRGKGQLSMTGQLGDVMKESGTLAYNFLRANCFRFGIPFEVFNNWDIHVHFPAGAIPKDGPSAGIAILTAMASAFSQRMVNPNMAMTGEITLRGKVLPVGGIKEKLLAAIRAGIKTVVMSSENKKDVGEIKQEYLQGLEIVYVEEMKEVLRHTLQKGKAEDALELLPADTKNGQSHGPEVKKAM